MACGELVAWCYITFMTTSKRRSFGVLLAILAVAIVSALAFADVPLVVVDSAYFADTGVTRSSVHLHWPLIIPVVTFFIGIALVFIPRLPKAAESAHREDCPPGSRAI
jgi:hypothetical protein